LLHSALAEYRHLVGLLDAAEGRLDEMAEQDQGVQILETVPGVGPRTAEAVVAHLHQPERFSSGEQVSAYVGLVPKQFQSGETDRRGRLAIVTQHHPGALDQQLAQQRRAAARDAAASSPLRPRSSSATAAASRASKRR
jgi:transposase